MAEIHHSDHNPPPDAPDLGRVAAWALLTAVVILFYWKVVLTNQFTWLSGYDLSYQVLPWLQYQAGEWKAGRLPLWEPFHWMGQPLVGQAQPGVFYPLNWILFLLPLRNGWLKPTHLHWYLVIVHLLAAWFAYLLARDLKLSRRAAILAGTVFTLSGWLGTNDWPQMINGAVWAPLVFLFVFRAIRGERVRRSSILGGFFLGMEWLAGHHQIPIFVSLAVACIWAWSALRDRRMVAAAVLFFALAGVTGAAQILPSLEYGKLAVRWVGSDNDPVGWDKRVPYFVHNRYGLGSPTIPGIVFPNMHENANPHTGAVAVGLALLGAALFWRRAEARALSFVGIGAILYSLAILTPFEGVFYSLFPMVEKARTPSFAVFIFGLCAAVLAAFGLDSVLAQRQHPWVKRAGQSMLVFGVLVMLLAAYSRVSQLVAGTGDARWIVTGLVALLMAALLFGYRNDGLRAGAVLLCTLALFTTEMSSTNTIYFQPLDQKGSAEHLRSLARHGDVAEFLRSQPGLYRVDADSAVVPYNFGDWYGHHQMGGYLASLTANVQRLPVFEDAGRRLLGVRYRASDRPDGFHNQLVYTGQRGVNVYENPSVLPRAFAAHQTEQSRTRDLMNAKLVKMSRDELRDKVLMLTAPPSLDRCDGSDVVGIQRYEPSRVTLRAEMACKGMVVLSDAWFPGWKAEVDGKSAEIHEVDGALRGVVVAQGAHTVEFKYRPASVYLGGTLSLIGGLLALGAAFFRRR